MSYNLVSINNSKINFTKEISITKTPNNISNIISKHKFNYRDFIFFFQQMNKILYKPFNKYYYNFFLSFKKHNVTVADKDYAHQFCFFLNLKIKNSICFYFIDKLDNLFFNNYKENTIFNFFVPCKGNKIDWTLFKYFWGQTKKYPSYYIELNYDDINKFEINKTLFFFKFYNLKFIKKSLFLQFSNYDSSSLSKYNFNLFVIKKYYKHFSKKNSFRFKASQQH